MRLMSGMTTSITAMQAGAVALGSAVGALLRWGAGLALNGLWAGFPLGTLLVNAVGGLLIGVAMVWFARSPDELLRLLLVTAGVVRIGLAHDNGDLAARITHAGGPPLAAIDDVVVAVTHSRGFEVWKI